MSSLSTAILPSGCLRNTPPPDTEESWFQNVICNGNENTFILHFYVQDVLAGKNQTVYEVARANITSNSPTSFGLVLAEPDYYSEEIGRVQGVVTSADLEVRDLSMNLNFVFTTGGLQRQHHQCCGKEPDNERAAGAGGGWWYRGLPFCSWICDYQHLLFQS
ncbi:UNVERIFIED_CONTAM: hypothetical protein Sradi_4721400 [Sesamum radiatum]|uniref:Dirigent protein n=1 Tax=Sesamum radiatum TaxID=300843 RepID=A0AAW2MWK6_SESRA